MESDLKDNHRERAPRILALRAVKRPRVPPGEYDGVLQLFAVCRRKQSIVLNILLTSGTSGAVLPWFANLSRDGTVPHAGKLAALLLLAGVPAETDLHTHLLVGRRCRVLVRDTTRQNEAEGPFKVELPRAEWWSQVDAVRSIDPEAPAATLARRR